jgi:hypothetical protein
MYVLYANKQTTGGDDGNGTKDKKRKTKVVGSNRRKTRRIWVNCTVLSNVGGF